MSVGKCRDTAFAARTFGYAYDAIGTRISATFSGATGNTHTIGYTKATGDGTQYATISNPGVALVTGGADPAASVTVNGVAAQARQSSHFAHELTVNNTNGPASVAVEVSATIGNDTETEQRHAFVPAQTANLTYDLDGNLTFDGFLEYTWDAENRLLTVRTRPGLAPAGSVMKDFRLEMTYDHAGRRIQRKLFYKLGVIYPPASDELFVYDGWNVVAVLNERSRLPRQTYVWGLDLSGTLQGAGGVGGLALIRDAPSATNHFVSYDGNGNVAGLVNAATGQQTADYVYDAFGNLLAAKGTFAIRNPWRFSTKVQDEASGLYYYGFRYYDPTTGRWTSRDPIGERGGVNVYGFVKNEGVMLIDRFGLDYGLWTGTGYYDRSPSSGTYKQSCCGGKIYDPNQSCCICERLVSRRETEEVTLTFRKADLPGGGTADMVLGKRHCSVTTSQGETGQGKIGAGIPGQGCEGCAYTLFTEMVDHTGQSAMEGVVNVKVRVNRCCFLEKVKKNTREGLWIPFINDCNTIMKDAVKGCGGDWDKAYAEYLRQNALYQKYWNMVEEGYQNQLKHGGPWN